MRRICGKCQRRPWAYDPGKPGDSCWWNGCDGILEATDKMFVSLDPYPIGYDGKRK